MEKLQFDQLRDWFATHNKLQQEANALKAQEIALLERIASSLETLTAKSDQT